LGALETGNEAEGEEKAAGPTPLRVGDNKVQREQRHRGGDKGWVRVYFGVGCG